MTITNDGQLVRLKEIGRVCALARNTMAAALRLGMTTLDLDEIGARILEAEGAISARR